MRRMFLEKYLYYIDLLLLDGVLFLSQLGNMIKANLRFLRKSQGRSLRHKNINHLIIVNFHAIVILTSWRNL
jgi:hypothetical protein